MRRPALLALPCLLSAIALSPRTAAAEEPLDQRFSFGGNTDFFATGAAMAEDGPDADTTRVDTLVQPALTEITDADVPAGAELRMALLYWGGSIENDDCAGTTIDDEVLFAAPGQAAAAVPAEVCYCSDAAAQSYDMQLCRADVTGLIDALTGTYSVDEFDALIENGSTNAASFSIVLVYSHPDLPARRIAVYDGLLTMWSGSNPEEVALLDGIDVDDPPDGDLTWYAIEGDVGGTGDESVSVLGLPGNLGLALSDAINPAGNPMNHTINTTVPPQSSALGVDIDQFDISAALSPNDTSVETTYSAGSDKYWIAYNVVGVNVYAPLFGIDSFKDWALEDDADQDGVPSPGDTIRYTLHLANTGDAVGSVDIEDPIPPEAASWTLVDDGGGVDNSTMDTLIVNELIVAPGGSVEVLFDVVIDVVPDQSEMLNVANFDAPPDGDAGQLWAEPVVISAEEQGGTDTDTGGDTTTDTSTGGSTDTDTTTTADTTGPGTESGTSETGGGDGESESDSDTYGQGDGDSGGGGGGNDEVGTDSGGAVDGDDGCNCRADGRGERAPLLGLALLALGAGLRRRRA
jgi:MYXO-CTERM domain-containing protein